MAAAACHQLEGNLGCIGAALVADLPTWHHFGRDNEFGNHFARLRLPRSYHLGSYSTSMGRVQQIGSSATHMKGIGRAPLRSPGWTGASGSSEREQSHV
jgi:hypothetical protein